MDEYQINEAIEQLKDAMAINEFLLKGLAPEQAQLELIAKSCVLLGGLDDSLESIKDTLCKPSNIKAA